MIFLLLALNVPLVDEPPSLRGMCIRAGRVVFATPLDPLVPVKFRVMETLRGKGPAVVEPGLRAQDVRSFDGPALDGDGKPQPRKCEQALLFLSDDGKLLGLRLVTPDGRVMGLDGAGRAQLRTARWSELVVRVRRDVAEVDRLRAWRGLVSPARKAAALEAWIARNRAALSCPPGEPDDEAPSGWEELSLGVFDWIIETGDHALAWRAIKLYAGLHGELLRPRIRVFDSEAGRAFLLARAKDESALVGDRARAVALLTGKHGKLADAVAALLTDAPPEVRLAAAEALGRVGDARQADAVVSAFMKAEGPLRQELAWLAAAMVPAAKWKEMTGNPPGVAAAMREVERGGSEIAFWLHVRTAREKVRQTPVIVVERVGPGGMVAETKTLAAEVAFVAEPWKAGWDGSAPVPLKFALTSLQAGATYRFRVEGFVGAGAGKQQWRSEPLTFTLPAGRPR